MRRLGTIFLIALCLALCGAAARAERPEDHAEEMLPRRTYTLTETAEVAGRQGVCCEDGSIWVSGSASLTRYSRDWQILAQNTDPFAGFPAEVNHIGDIDVYRGDARGTSSYFTEKAVETAYTHAT